ncbi:hypothetical protein EZS27_019465 [termite gut metagenome]|uniref:Endo-beta-1,6-galactanase-like domain-containing protein n=1 Tax=termite gut metagenome TaxID=433724 RepID=A0A5J4RD24_9ZZZZ
MKFLKISKQLIFIVISTICFACTESTAPELNENEEENKEENKEENEEENEEGNKEENEEENEERNVTININKTYQVIESFSASDCWVPNYIGNHWTENEKEKIAQLLFSRKINNGVPEGIGLSGWRFNLGGGTADQGSASGIEDIARRAESFMDPTNGTLNWTKQGGQQYFLEKAKGYGCEQFVMFSNTPPVYLTQNGKGYSDQGAYSNLKVDCYDDFAAYITTVIQHFKTEKDINFSYISPVNEPQYNWASGQEGTGWQNSEIKKLAVELNSALVNTGLDTKILLAEAGAWSYLYEIDGDGNRKNVIANLFNNSSSTYVGDLSHVAPIICGHSYWTDGNWHTLVDTRTKVAAAAQSAGLKTYQTEWSMLGDHFSTSEYVGHNNATYMDIALYMSKVIHCDLTYANVSSWSFWTSMDVERWGHKNRFFLIRITPAGGDYGDITKSGTHFATKTLWALGNYSLFVKPGYQRVDMEIKDYSNKLFGSAYISPDKKILVGVYTNLSNNNYDVKAQLNDLEIESIQTYTTSQSSNLSAQDINNVKTSIIVKPQSIMTVIYNLK